VEIRGRVTRKNAAGPLSGVITARGAEMSVANADVAEDGTFALRGLRAGTYSLSYIGEKGGQSLERQVKAPIADLTIELPAPAEIRGRVTDASTGAVLRSYRVAFGMESQDLVDVDGFSFEVSPDAGELLVTAPGYVPVKKELVAEAGKPTEVNIALTPGRAVDGVVTNESGSPVAEAWVKIGGFYQIEQTGTNGEFHLPAITRDAATLTITADGYVEREIAVAPGDRDVRVDVTLSSGRKISGHVFTSEGAPVSGAVVHASGKQNQSAKTDENGAFTLSGLAAGPYTLHASRDELQSEVVPIGDEVPSDLALMMMPSKGAGRIHGVVKGFTGGAWMYGVVRTEQGAFAMIGRDGKYTIDRAEAGDVELQASAQSPSGAVSSAPVRVTVVAGGDVEANLVFRDDVTVRGTVTESGAPAVARNVVFESGGMRWSATTNEQGLYELTGVEPGIVYDVAVEGGASAYNTRHHVAASGTFDIRIEWSRVEGRVVDAGGTPVEGAKVTITAAAADVTTDVNGAFSLSVSRGAHVLTVAKEGLATHTRRVEPDAGTLSITLARTDGLRVRLTDARSGNTLDGYVVAVDAAGLQVARTSEAQKDGTMLVPVAAGAYRISVSADGYASQSMRVNVPHPGEVRLSLTPGGTLIVHADRASADLLKLVLPSGEEYVRCQCNGIAEIRLTGLSTTIENVAPGSYTMQLLDPKGLVKATQVVTIAEGKTTVVEMHVPE
jgi:hypothetical protein